MSRYEEDFTGANYSTSYCYGRCPSLCRGLDEPHADCRLRQWFLAFSILLVLHLYYNMEAGRTKYVNINKLHTVNEKTINLKQNASSSNATSVAVYKYPLTNSSEVIMTFVKSRNTAYTWFESMKYLLVNIGKDEDPVYRNDTPNCILYISTLGSVDVDKTVLELGWVEKYHSDVKPGGFYAPKRCRSKYRVAIFVPYHCRNHKRNVGVFLYYLHRLLKKQLMEYRIFFIEQFGTEKWNKGLLYNIAYLESQRFGTWNCLIFHEADLVPMHERIIYGCAAYPVHMSPAIECSGFVYANFFGGVTAFTPEQYEYVNGYSNSYWNLEGVDHDMWIRLTSQDYTITRYNSSIAIYALLAQSYDEKKLAWAPLNVISKTDYHFEGLSKTRYSLVNVTKRKLFTHILANISPDNMKTSETSIIKHSISLNLHKLLKHKRNNKNL